MEKWADRNWKFLEWHITETVHEVCAFRFLTCNNVFSVAIIEMRIRFARKSHEVIETITSVVQFKATMLESMGFCCVDNVLTFSKYAASVLLSKSFGSYFQWLNFSKCIWCILHYSHIYTSALLPSLYHGCMGQCFGMYGPW